MLFTVGTREVHACYREVEADTWREAVKKAEDGNWLNEVVEYSHQHALEIVEVTAHMQDEDSTDDYHQESEAAKNLIRSTVRNDRN